MPEKLYNVSWSASFHIWLGLVTRVACVGLFLFAVARFGHFLTPLVYEGVARADYDYSGLSALLKILFAVYISFWALRQSLTDRYAGFHFAVKTKEKGRSLFRPDKRLGQDVMLPVWWSFAWRTLFPTATILVGIMAAAASRGLPVASYFYLLGGPLGLLDGAATLALSLWALHESLADRYRMFVVSAEPRSFYTDGNH